jgi:transcriptional regulator with XRE-family HTH domain
MHIGNKLRYLREKKGLQQTELASILNTAVANVNRHETGQRKPDYDTLLKYAKYYKVSTDYFLNEEKDINENTVIPNIKNIIQIVANGSKTEFIKLINDVDFDEDMLDMYLSGHALPSFSILALIADSLEFDISYFFEKNNLIDIGTIRKLYSNTTSINNSYIEAISKAKKYNISSDDLISLIDSKIKEIK